MAVRIELRRDAGKIDPTRERWIRRRQIARVQGPPDPAAVASLVDHRGRVLGHGLYSPESSIVLRLLCSGELAPPEDWLEQRLTAALRTRAVLGLGTQGETTGYREVNSEGDGIPGLVVDRFGDWRVVQITTAPIASRRAQISGFLRERAPMSGGQIVLLPESAAAREGFEAGIFVEPTNESCKAPAQLSWLERGQRFEAPAPPGQKTGAYHDQRDNRSHFAALVAARPQIEGVRPRMLDLGCHVGGFAIAAAARGIEVLAVDQSAVALAAAGRNAAANGVEDRIENVRADMFGPLDDPAIRAKRFDALIFDPPKIASSRRDLKRACHAMTRSLMRLLPCMNETALIGLCSCSHHLGWDELDRVMLDASPQAKRITRWGPGVDHPVSPGHVEGEYLRVAVYCLT